VQRADGYRRRVGQLLATRQRRLLLLDGLAICALAEAPLAGIESEALAAAPLVIVSLASLHLAAAVATRMRARRRGSRPQSVLAASGRYRLRPADPLAFDGRDALPLAEHDV
jgi:putative Ca2+/H+ antiporter (TMEM165/GDT1 family)